MPPKIPTYALLLFGKSINSDSTSGIITVDIAGDRQVKFRAWTRIAALVNGLRRLLNKELAEMIGEPRLIHQYGSQSEVVKTMLALIENDGS